ncbi:MAG: fucose isomerase [Spirochaetae bacterium HGW-Spirochaetae-3]|jgi:L-fucose isomerase-like protein|nr:MAG: fucose isomerase [Spirochaetae bacterium HGW-Spirochaetae-3]
MKRSIRLGLVCFARETFDFKAAAEIYGRIAADLSGLENVVWERVPDLVISVEDARKAGARFAAASLDAVVCVSGTFHLGHLVLELRKQAPLPILLWGLDELPYDGGKIRLNSVCGVNLDASNLYKAGVDDYHATVGSKIDENWVDAIRAVSAMKNSHLGIAGYRAHGFFNLSVSDPDLYGDTGLLLDHFELSDIFGEPVEAESIASSREKMLDTFDVSGISEAQVSKVSELTARLDSFCARNALDALAIRCWPEYARDFGISPCAAMSLLQSEGRLLACEGDVEGAISMLLHKAIGAETPYLFDFSQFDFEENFALFWHCGVAPCNLWDGSSCRSLDTYFAGGKGVTADFVLKSGELSIARIDAARGKRRLFLQRARAVPMEKELKGTYMKAVFDRPVREILDLIIEKGIAHHASVAYGDFIEPLRIVARLKGWEIVE